MPKFVRGLRLRRCSSDSLPTLEEGFPAAPTTSVESSDRRDFLKLAGFAFASTLAAGESFTTIELKINYLRPVREAQLRAEGHVVQRGRTVGYVECEITDENGKLVAKSNSTCLVLRGEQAGGR